MYLSLFCLDFQETGNSANFNESDIVDEDFSDAPVKGQKIAGGVKGRDTCSIPCDITVKLLRDEKHSICGEKKIIFLCVIVSSIIVIVVQNVCVCLCVCRPVTADSVGVWTQHPEADQRRDGGAAEGSGHPQQSGKMESSFSLLVTSFLSVSLAGSCIAVSHLQVTELTTKVQTLNSEVQRSNTEMYSIKPVQSHGTSLKNTSHDTSNNLIHVSYNAQWHGP